jgi:hypothetical protein
MTDRELHYTETKTQWPYVVHRNTHTGFPGSLHSSADAAAPHARYYPHQRQFSALSPQFSVRMIRELLTTEN